MSPASRSVTHGTRLEDDTFGAIEVGADRLWGAQTERARRHFPAGDERMPVPLVRAIARVKQAAAVVNRDLRQLAPEIADAIARAALEIGEGRHDDQFPLPVYQSGSGTQTNMNVNEVIANRASELLGGPRGRGRLVHPNDHVNRGQSSNDVVPTAMHLAALDALRRRVVPETMHLRDTLLGKAAQFARVVKIGRTHLQDAVPMTLGQEFSGYAAQLDAGVAQLEACMGPLCALAIGGTAVGTGLNTHPEFGERVAAHLALDTGLPLRVAANRFAALAAHDPLVQAHGQLRGVAGAVLKIVNDVRWLASGPRCGLGELRLPENEPGSSIMPGKVNPTQLESLAMAAVRVLGNDVTMGIAGSGGFLELNVYKPLLIATFLESCRLLADGCEHVRRFAIEGLEADVPRVTELVSRSLMLATALAPHIGYDQAASLAHRAHESGAALRDVALEAGMRGEDFDRWTNPQKLAGL